MKKILVFLMVLTASCIEKQQSPELSQTEQSIIEYARQHVSQMMQDKTFTIEGIDTLLTDDIPALKAEKYSIQANEVLGDVYITWKRYKHELERVKIKSQYDGYWRLVYKVGVGNITIRILMDSTGMIPVATEEEFYKRMNKLKCNDDGSGIPKFHF